MPPQPVESLSVLIVDDEQRLRDMLLRAVGEMGYHVRTAPTSEQALKMLQKAPAHIMVIDLNLPHMGGIELFERVRAKWPNTQVIILTGFGDLESARKAIHMDVVDFLGKPCTLGNLESALSRAQYRIQQQAPEIDPTSTGDVESNGEHNLAMANRLDHVEQTHILAILHKNNGNRAATAAELGISLRTLYYRLAEYQKQTIG